MLEDLFGNIIYYVYLCIMKIYIYTLEDNQGNIRYVGKTTNIKRRLYSHIAEAKLNKSKRYVLNWIRYLLSINEKPILRIIEECNETNWIEREKHWISYYRNIISNLCNSCDEGKGGLTKDNLSNEQLQKKKEIMSNTFSKFSKIDKENIWNMILNNKTQIEIQSIYHNYTRSIDFGVRNGRQWREITKLPIIHNNLKRQGYTCRNGLYMIRRKINNKVQVIFSSRNENEILQYLKSLELDK